MSWGIPNLRASISGSTWQLTRIVQAIRVGPNGCQCSGELRFDRSELDTLALQWASEQSLPWPDRVALLVKLNKLPWADDDITFHWGHWEEIEKPGINGFCDPSSNSDTKDAPS